MKAAARRGSATFGFLVDFLKGAGFSVPEYCTRIELVTELDECMRVTVKSLLLEGNHDRPTVGTANGP